MFNFCRLFFEGCSILNQPVPIANSFFWAFLKLYIYASIFPKKKKDVCVCVLRVLFLCVFGCVCVCVVRVL